VLVGSPGSVSNNTQKVQRLHTLFFEVTNVWKECKLIVRNDSEEFGLFNNRDESTTRRKFLLVVYSVSATMISRDVCKAQIHDEKVKTLAKCNILPETDGLQLCRKNNY